MAHNEKSASRISPTTAATRVFERMNGRPPRTATEKEFVGGVAKRAAKKADVRIAKDLRKMNLL